jgi:hypothetical protein
MTMKKIGLCSAVLLLVACTAADHDVRFTFDQDADFSKFKTYKWLTVRDSSKVDDRWDKRIEDVMDTELAKKGLTKTNTDTADLYVGCQIGIGAETQFTPYNTSWGYAPGGLRALDTGALAGSQLGKLSRFTLANWLSTFTIRKTIVWSGGATSVRLSTLRPPPRGSKRTWRRL